MMKNNLKLVIFSATFVIGLIILMNIINFGNSEASNLIRANGGSMDTNKYMILLEQSIIKYRFIGSILSVLGGLGVLITTNKSHNTHIPPQ